MLDKGFEASLIDRFAWRTDEVGSMQDLSGILSDPDLLTRLGEALADLHRERDASVVVSPQSQGWVLGPLVAQSLNVGFVQAYKDMRGGDLADGMYVRLTPPDYKDRVLALSVRRRLIPAGARVLIVDDWIETGGQVDALARIISDAGAELVGVATIVDDAEAGTRRRFAVRGLLRIEQVAR